MKHLVYVTALAGLSVFIAGCDRDNNDPGWDYFPDMAYSWAYEPFSENPNFADGKTMREPVKGTISREMQVFPYEFTDADRIRAGKELSNPIPANDTTIYRGKEVFTTYCLMCHGEKGDGLGYLYTSKKYLRQPASLINNKMKEIPEGEIYHSITLGFGIMGAQGPLIRPEDRWKAILYIKHVLQQPNEVSK